MIHMKRSSASTITAATCNVLYEPYYIQYVDQYPIAIKKRCSLFKQALRPGHILNGCDILCFQEWPYNPGELRKQFEQEVVMVNGHKETKYDYFNNNREVQYKRFNNTLLDAYSPNDYYYIIDSIAQKDGVLTLINKHKFTILSYEFMVFTPNKKMMVAHLQTKKKKAIGIINTHIPFMLNEDHADHFSIIKDTIDRAPKNLPWIICGDFNYSVLQGTDKLNKKKYNKLQHYVHEMKSNADMLPLVPTSTGAQQGFNLNDFIFYSKQFTVKNLIYSPENPNNLLRHVNQDIKHIKHFSDHAIIKMALEL